MTIFNELPASVQAQVKSTLCAYSSVRVYLKGNGDYEVTTAVCIHSGNYTETFLGEFKAEDIFTSDERIANYIRTFRDFPWNVNGIHYTGKKNWHELMGGWTDVTLDSEGNAVFS